MITVTNMAQRSQLLLHQFTQNLVPIKIHYWSLHMGSKPIKQAPIWYPVYTHVQYTFPVVTQKPMLRSKRTLESHLLTYPAGKLTTVTMDDDVAYLQKHIASCW
jgi:hypothetical protein